MNIEIVPPKRTLRAHMRHIIVGIRRFLREKTRQPRRIILGKRVFHGSRASHVIRDAIISNKPLLVSRYGTTEATIIKFFLHNETAGECNFPAPMKDLIMKNSGFFPGSDEALSRFCRESLAVMSEIDILGVRSNPIEHQYWALEKLMMQSAQMPKKLVDLSELMPIGRKQSWTKALAGRRVLVIHPFANTIRAQYKNRKLIFPGSEFLPDINLDVIRAVQSAGANQGRAGFSDWFAARDAMVDEIQKRDFDIALIGAGAYGMFLGAECKKLGRQAIHIGGATQLLFGILGRRWTEEFGKSSRDIRGHFNGYWVGAAQDEIPENERSVEGGGYWV